MADPSGRGLDGTPIPESGMAVRTFRLESASVSASTADSVGAGTIGDSIGTTTTPFITTTATTRGAPHSTTVTVTTEAEPPAAASTTAPVPQPGPSTETARRLEVTRNPKRRAGRDPARSAATTAADRHGAIHRAEAPAMAAVLMAAEHRTAAGAAGRTNRILVQFLVNREIFKWRKTICRGRIWT